MFPPHSGNAQRDARIHKEVRSQLEATKRFQLLAEPALDLEGTQLAVDCVEDSGRCYGVVLQQAQAQVLIAASAARKGSKLTLTLTYYDAKAGEVRSASRSGAELNAALLDEIPSMLAELIPAPAKDEPTPVAKDDGAPKPKPLSPEEAAEPPAPEPQPAFERSHGVPLGPVLLGAGGVLAIGGGVALGVMMKGTESDYRDSNVTTQAQADAANSRRELGQRQALIANVLFGVGAAALVASGIWLAVDLSSGGGPQETQTALLPVLGPDAAGLVLSGSFQEPRL